jgi:nicotinate-nucleotide adenylyltransferase
MRVGIYGGSFNPVHLGHIRIVQFILAKNKVDRVIIVPVYKNPLKQEQPSLPAQLRCQMLEAVFNNSKGVSISLYEIKKQQASFSYETVEYYHQLNPLDSLFLILGQDTFNQFHLWKNYQRILELAKLLVYKRVNTPINENQSITKDKVEWIEGEIPDISSTLIRSSSQNKTQLLQWLHPSTVDLWQTYWNKQGHINNGN